MCFTGMTSTGTNNQSNLCYSPILLSSFILPLLHVILPLLPIPSLTPTQTDTEGLACMSSAPPGERQEGEISLVLILKSDRPIHQDSVGFGFLEAGI
jgi:hypothetical protein